MTETMRTKRDKKSRAILFRGCYNPDMEKKKVRDKKVGITGQNYHQRIESE